MTKRPPVEYSQEVAERLGRILGPSLVGVYLHGSVALGDSSPNRSDIEHGPPQPAAGGGAGSV